VRSHIACFAFAALLTLLSCFLAAESLIGSRILDLQPGVLDYPISERPIIKGSEAVFTDSLKLARDVDYEIDHQTGTLKLLRYPETNSLSVQYLLVPSDLVEPRFLYEVREPSDSLFRAVTPRQRTWMADDGKLIISGAKTFAITFSDDDAFDLKQSLYVNLNGELSPNVNISAQLSDSQSKLTPEGDSKELSSLDQVFIRVYGRQYEVAMGDLNWKFEGTRYIDYQTSIEGLNAWYRDRHFAQAGFTASGGKPAFLSIPIIDGKQGPYFLNPTGFQSTYLVIAGSEAIYRDGNLLQRGTDYYIDYSEGSVMFRTLVVSSNQVNAYFQYADDYYRQSTYFNSSRIEILPGLALSHHFIHQTDSKNNPLLYDFTSSDLDSLRLVGDNVAWGNGIIQMGAGEGSYIRKFTLEGDEYYEYAPSDTTADYNLTFSFVGSGNGDYEEYSSGKFRYVGHRLGAWLPQKRLIPAVQRSNADLALRFENESLKLGMEGIYTANDKNTFSDIDDNDNQSGFLHAYGALESGESSRESYARLDLEKRWADSFLFTQNIDTGREFDFSLLQMPDSLARTQIDLTLGSKYWSWWKPELTLRYGDVADYHIQRALRLVSQSSGSGIIPSLILRSTLSSQDADPVEIPNSLMQYHDLNSSWDFRWLKAKLLLNYNSLVFADTSSLQPSNRYYRINPQLEVGDPKISLSQFGFAQDNTELKDPGWRSLASSQTYALKHSTTTLNHTLNLDFTHRAIQKEGDEARSNYDLISLRNSHYFLKQAIMLMGNYQLNQTEFFPRIRELEYVGNGLGLYDSTGVYTPDGDYDYSYIISDQGTLSTEINTQLSLYLKPGNVLPAWRRVHSDIIVQATEQGSDMDDWRSYVFWPGTVYNEGSTIFGKQSFAQTLWLDLVPNRIQGNLRFQSDRSLDNRYQGRTRTSEQTRALELDFKRYWGNNINAKYENSRETDTRYLSDIRLQNLLILIQRNLSASSLATLNLSVWDEKGSQQSGEGSYGLRGLGFAPAYRGVWGTKGRVSGGLGIRYNQRSGSDFLTFLPEKRGGVLFNWNVSAVYRLNGFSSATFDYNGTAYPGDELKHTLKLEFKAEL